MQKFILEWLNWQKRYVCQSGKCQTNFFLYSFKFIIHKLKFCKIAQLFLCSFLCVSFSLERTCEETERVFFNKNPALILSKIIKKTRLKKKITLSFLKFSNMLTGKSFVSFYSLTEVIKIPIFTLCSRNFRYNSMVEEPHDRSDSSSSEDDSDREDCCIMWLGNFFPKKDKFGIKIDQNT